MGCESEIVNEREPPMDHAATDEDRPGPWLRALAVLGAVALPLAWLASLSGQPGFVSTNLARVVGAILVAGVTGALYRPASKSISWSGMLAGGVVGSLAVTVISVFVPALGRFDASGWLVSGFVGGVIVALVAFAIPVRAERTP